MFSVTTILKNGFNIKTFAQIVLPAVITFILFVVSIFQFAFPKLEQIFIDRKREMIKELTQTVLSELSNFKKDADSGVCTVDQAKHLAGEHMRNIRYGEEKKDYFWIIDMYPTMIIHPFLTGLENTSLREYIDPNGKKLFVEMVKAVAEDGYGYIDYMWQWKDDSTKIVQKLSYVQGFEPWGWIIGTGIYVEDVYQELSVIRNKFILLSIMILGLFSFPLIYIVRNGILQEKCRYLTQLKLVESENKYRTIVEYAGTAVVISENDKSISFVNSEFESLSGQFRNEVVGRSWTEIFDENEAEKMAEYHRLRRIDPSNVPKKYESKLYNKAGELKTVLVAVELIPETLRSIITLRDITEQMKAEEALKESEEKYSKAFRATPDSFIITDVESGRIIEVNTGFEKTFGYTSDEALNRTTMALKLWADQEDRIKTISILKMDGRVGEFYCKMRKKSGEILDAEISMEYIEIKEKKHLLTITRDVTERKKAEKERQKLERGLFHAQKMELIGSLAGGIAHDFNNALTGISGYAELLELYLDEENSKTQNCVNSIKEGVDRASALTKQLLGFARGGKYNPEPVDLNNLVKYTLKMSEKIFDKNIKIKFNLNNTPHVLADKHQIDQVLTNLFINAKDAMPHGGKLYIETDQLCINSEEAKYYDNIAPGNYVKLAVEDTGTGIAKDILSRIFEPFFTTKSEGKGTGLGLASVYGIIKNHKGTIKVYSEPDIGTTFSIYLPVSKEEEKNRIKKNTKISGDASILIIDDEINVRNVGKILLEALGYRVITAENGNEGIELYKKKKDKIDLVLLDYVMPDMNGKQTFSAIKAINPNVKVIVVSGYSKSGGIEQLLKNGAIGFIQKPFKSRSVSQVINTVLKN